MKNHLCLKNVRVKDKKVDESKKVGVVVPIYNVEKYLKECLDSVIN